MDRRARCHTDDVLRDDIEWLFLNSNWIERLFPNEFGRNRCFHEVVHVGRHKHAVTCAIQRMTGTTNTLNGARYAFRRCHHHDEIDGTDVDSQLQAGRAHHRAQLAIFQTVLHLQPHTAVE